MKTYKSPEGIIQIDRRIQSSKDNVQKLLLMTIMVMVAVIGFLIPKWIDPIQSRVLAIELKQDIISNDLTEKREVLLQRISKIEQKVEMVSAQVDRVDLKIDKLLEKTNTPPAIRPTMVEKET